MASIGASTIEGGEYTVASNGVLTAMSLTSSGSNYYVYFPRAIISRHKVINADFSMGDAPNTNGVTNNVYYAS